MSRPLKELMDEFLNEWKSPSLEEHLESLLGSGEIYDKEYGQFLEAATQEPPSFDIANEVITPIFLSILEEAAQNDQQLYMDMLQQVKEAHFRLAGWMEEKTIEIAASQGIEEVDRRIAMIESMLQSGHWALTGTVGAWKEEGRQLFHLTRSKRP